MAARRTRKVIDAEVQLRRRLATALTHEQAYDMSWACEIAAATLDAVDRHAPDFQLRQARDRMLVMHEHLLAANQLRNWLEEKKEEAAS